jgi:hypothetical protein
MALMVFGGLSCLSLISIGAGSIPAPLLNNDYHFDNVSLFNIQMT